MSRPSASAATAPIVLLAVLVAFIPAPSTEGPAPVRRALLVGVNEYLTDQFADLRGAVNDVQAMAAILNPLGQRIGTSFPAPMGDFMADCLPACVDGKYCRKSSA